ncbi:response regulator [Methylocapsa sp. S129]|uniref:response regulator n=1 Tax=Methylocapsa sp. S129 TaxID=1641869 RepID=UPI00131C9A1D|nr:response regulator [Methylocapsa sp. S129]
MSDRRRVLVVEDEMMVAMLVEDMILELGYDVVGPAMTLESGLALARDEPLDGAILDVNLGHGARTTPIAEVLKSRGVPFMFATGYGSNALIEGFRDAPVLKKPFSMKEFTQALERLIK